MIIGVPKEVKDHESRVGITPAGVRALVDVGHTVLVETQAGELSALPDDDYQSAGAEIVGSAHNVWGLADMVVKVKEPVEKEYVFFREGLLLFTYLHLAPLPVLTQQLLDKKVIGIAYETIRDKAGTLPLLTPMSEVAGRMSVQVGATFLQKEYAGWGSWSSSGGCLHHRRRHRWHQRREDRPRHGRESHHRRFEPESSARP
jgi:alanine dehydrogenase